MQPNTFSPIDWSEPITAHLNLGEITALVLLSVAVSWFYCLITSGESWRMKYSPRASTQPPLRWSNIQDLTFIVVFSYIIFVGLLMAKMMNLTNLNAAEILCTAQVCIALVYIWVKLSRWYFDKKPLGRYFEEGWLSSTFGLKNII